jgi:hypothetical protein
MQKTKRSAHLPLTGILSLLVTGIVLPTQASALDPPQRALAQPGKLTRPASAVDASRFKLSDQALADIRFNKIEQHLAALEKQNADLRKQIATMTTEIATDKSEIKRIDKKVPDRLGPPGLWGSYCTKLVFNKTVPDDAVIIYWQKVK